MIPHLKEALWLCLGIALLVVGGLARHSIPDEWRWIFYFALLIILIPIFYYVLSRLHFGEIGGQKILLSLIILILGIISFCHAILKFDILTYVQKLFS